MGHAVGYDSPSQFSREYKRAYGSPPGQGRYVRASTRSFALFLRAGSLGASKVSCATGAYRERVLIRRNGREVLLDHLVEELRIARIRGDTGGLRECPAVRSEKNGASPGAVRAAGSPPGRGLHDILPLVSLRELRGRRGRNGSRSRSAPPEAEPADGVFV